MGTDTAPDGFADQFRVNAGYGRDLPAYVRGLGIDFDGAAGSLGLSRASFSDFLSDVSLDRFCRLLEKLAAASGDDTLGLNYASAYGLGAVGPLGYGVRNAPTLRDALDFLVKFARITVDLETMSVENDAERVTVSWTYSPAIVARAQFTDMAAYLVMKLLWLCAGFSFRTAEACFERGAPRSAARHQEIFAPKVRFQAAINAVTLPPELLRTANPSADGRLYEVIAVQCEQLLAKRISGKDLVTRFREDLLANLECGDIAVADVARRLGLSERSLQRRLSECDTSYHAEHEALRKQQSFRLLRHTALPLSEVARRLGYASQSAFTRAATRWHGKPPGALRSDG